MNIIDGENVSVTLCSVCGVICCTNDPEYAEKRRVEHRNAHGAPHYVHTEMIAFTVVCNLPGGR